MSVLEIVTIDEKFIKYWSDGMFDIADVRCGTYRIFKTNEIVKVTDYPVLYALRNLNYNNAFTDEDISIIKKNVEKKRKKMRIIEQINNLQKELENLN